MSYGYDEWPTIDRDYGPDEMLYPEWMERDPVTGEVPELGFRTGSRDRVDMWDLTEDD